MRYLGSPERGQAIGNLSQCMLYGNPSCTQAALAAWLGRDLQPHRRVRGGDGAGVRQAPNGRHGRRIIGTFAPDPEPSYGSLRRFVRFGISKRTLADEARNERD